MYQLEDAYKFTIENGIVTAIFEFEDGIWKPESIDSDETYSVDPSDANVVIKTEVENGVTKTERYVGVNTANGLVFYEQDDDDDSGDDSGSGQEDDLYRFTFDDGNNVTSVSKFDDGLWKQLRLDGNETYAVDPTLGRLRVIKTEIDDGEVETEIYEDLDANGDYVEIGSSQDLDDDVYVGGSTADQARGGLGDDEIYGNGGDDDLYGDDGDDDLFGDDGGDDLYGGSGVDELYGGGGNDLIAGDSGADDLRGNDGSDDLDGGAGHDMLQGGNGTDKLTGGLGLDRLTGGLAADSFVYSSKLDSVVGSGRDVIVDFSAAQRDRLNLSAIDANELLAGNQAFSWLGTRAFSGRAGQLRYSVSPSPSGLVLQGDLNGDRAADFEIALLGLSSLTSSQVLL